MDPAERQEQVLSVVKQRPEISRSDLAREIGVSPAYVTKLIGQMRSKLKSVDGGLLVK
jgi:DNA-binding MarR family transcriptional regulator